MNTQVLIVGAGPTGLALALWLSQFNIPLRIIDKDKGPGETSRAMGVQARTLELYHQIGIADEVIAKGVIAKAFHLRVSGSEKACGQLDDMGENISPYPFILAFPQDEHERLLLAQLEKKGITVERQTELLQFSQTDTDVCAVLKLQDASTTEISVPYLCGCDGARSTVRTELKIDFQGGTYSQLFYVADADVSGVAANDDLQLCLSEQEFTMVLPVRSSGTHRLIGIALPALSSQTKISFKDVMPAILRDTQLKISAVHWFSTYHVHHRVAQHFREKRTFLLGDAAHIHSPVGGQGMNTGIADAINLAWKLAAVIQQRATPLLLDTYQTERKAFALKLVSTTDRLFQIMTSVGTFGKYWRMKLFPFIVSHIIHYKAVRRFLFKTISQTSLHYRHSQLNQGRVGKLRSGDRLPWVNYGDHDNYVPLTALDWQVHVYGVVSSDYAAQLQKLLIPLHVFPSDARAKAVGLQQDVIFLVRPDGYLGLVDTQQDFKKLKKYLCDNKIISRRVKTRLDI